MNIITKAIVSAFIVIASVTGLAVQPSQPSSQAPTQAPESASQALTQAPVQAPTEDLTEAPQVVPNTSVEVAQRWANVMLESAGIELMSDVQMVFTNAYNCGANASTAALGGCTYTLENGNHLVVLSPGLANTQWGNHILFHELGHTAGLGECDAEAFAHQFEEVAMWSYPECKEGKNF
jgi:hypothetical protein